MLAGGACRAWLTGLLVSAAHAQFPFGEPEPPVGPPSGMGDQIGEMKIIDEPAGVEKFIDSPVVSLVMFTEDEDSNETNWFMLFSIMVERSINVDNGDARVNWAVVDNKMLRKSRSDLIRTPGIWLFCISNYRDGLMLPIKVMSEEAVQKAGAFILDALASVNAERIDGTWYKQTSSNSEAKSEL